MTENTGHTEIKKLKGIGEKKAQAFKRLGVEYADDLVLYFPYRYEDRSIFKKIAETENDEAVCLNVIMADEPRLAHIRKGMDLVKIKAFDETGRLDITFFNQSYVKNMLRRGTAYNLYGRIKVEGSRYSMINPVFEQEDKPGDIIGSVLPVYSSTSGLSQKDIRSSVKQALELYGFEEPLNLELVNKYRLCSSEFALRNIHFPSDYAALNSARRRIAFEELFILSCALGTLRKNSSKKSAFKYVRLNLSEFYASLPFSPTKAQLRAIDEALSDIKSGSVMNRLVQGDVGSGKTLVASALIYINCINGYCSAMMAPTEILAEQHYNTLKGFLAPFGFSVALLTGSVSSKDKKIIKEKLKSGEIDLIIGTHALFSADVEYKDLALIITDEQHRFGVAQRSAIISKGSSPNVLVMSATPIPRTLALIIYGDLDVSVIDELPPGRQKTDTFAVNEAYRERLEGFILKTVSEGHQVFIVCPKVEEGGEDDADDFSPSSGLKSSEEYSNELSRKFKNLKVGCVHGRLSPDAKESVMSDFTEGNLDVLVSTTVIEVGVDVPNATLMIIENAERFGLSQLHQLRGRVGRGKAKSYCILVSDAKNEEARERLKIMCSTNDGFKISEEDLRLRGPGDFFGSRQHGLPELHIANLSTDTNILKAAHEEAEALLNKDPQLSSPENNLLRKRVDRIFINSESMFN